MVEIMSSVPKSDPACWAQYGMTHRSGHDVILVGIKQGGELRKRV